MTAGIWFIDKAQANRYILLKNGFLTSNGITIPITNDEVMSMKSRREKRKKDCEINEIRKTESTMSN